MNQIVKWIGIVVGLLLTILLVVFLINGANWGRNTSNSTMSDTQNTINAAANTKFTQYDGRTVTGSEVTAAIETAQGQDYAVVVATSKLQSSSKKLLVFGRALSTDPTYTSPWSSTTTASVTGVSLGSSQSTTKVGVTKDTADDNYINPNGKFLGKMIMDANDTIIGIYFVQK